MKRILVKSVYDAFDYVMDHYYPYGMEDMAPRKDKYAVISIQDTHTKGFGIRFEKSESCMDVLTLFFDFRYRYEGVDYHVLINGSKHKMDPKDEWAGPLYGSMEHKGVF